MIPVVVLSAFVCADDMFLTQTIFEGRANEYEFNGHRYVLELAGAYDKVQTARFTLNGEKSDFLKQDEEYTFSDGSKILVREVYASDEGDDLVQYDFFPSGKGTIISEPQQTEIVIDEPEQTEEETVSEETQSEETTEETKAEPEPAVQEPVTAESGPVQDKPSENLSEQTSPAPTVDVTQKEPFFARVWKWFKNFFV
jgi:hypothetical protein